MVQIKDLSPVAAPDPTDIFLGEQASGVGFKYKASDLFAAMGLADAFAAKAPVAINEPVGVTALPLSSALGAPLLWPQADVVPERHLTNLLGNKTPSLALISDSTGTPDWPDSAGVVRYPNSVDPSQALWGVLRQWFRNHNPEVTWNFDSGNPITGNYAIGGMTFSHVLETGATLAGNGVVLPTWWTDTSKTWLQIVEADAPDVLVFNMGINYAYFGYEETGVNNLAYFIGQIFTQLGTWTKVPNVFFITNKVMNTEITAGGGSFNPGPNETYKGVAALLRTLCRSGGALFSAGLHPRLSRLGLLDFGRMYGIVARGKDYANQHMQIDASAVQTGINITNVPYTLANLSDGDFEISVTLPNAGNGVIATAGVSTLVFSLNGFNGQVVYCTFLTNGVFNASYTPIVKGSAFHTTAPNIVLPAGDVTIDITCKQERLTIIVNGAVYLDVSVPRFICGGPLTVASTTAPTSPVTLNVTQFLDGFAAEVPTAFTEDYAWGGYGVTQPNSGGGVGGGNGGNHPPSWLVAACDNQVMQAARLSAPVGDLFKSVQQVETPASGSTVQIADDTGTLIIKGSATLADLTIELTQQPTAVMDITIIFQAGVTSLTLTAPSGYTINVPVSGQQIAAGARVFLHLDETVWC